MAVVAGPVAAAVFRQVATVLLNQSVGRLVESLPARTGRLRQSVSVSPRPDGSVGVDMVYYGPIVASDEIAAWRASQTVARAVATAALLATSGRTGAVRALATGAGKTVAGLITDGAVVNVPVHDVPVARTDPN